MGTYTAFCQQDNGRGTVWIGTVEAVDQEQAIDAARDQCAIDWEWDPERVHCLGLALGGVTILYWDDIDA